MIHYNIIENNITIILIADAVYNMKKLRDKVDE